MSRRALSLVLMLGVAASARSPESEADKTLYALGAQSAANLGALHLKPAEIALVLAGFDAGLHGKGPTVDQSVVAATDAVFQRRAYAQNQKYLDSEARKPGAKRYPEGYIITELRPGSGATPEDHDALIMDFKGELLDGTQFESTYKRGGPARMSLQRVVPCWTAALQHMHEGGKYRLVCPSELAFGEDGFRPLIPSGSILLFEIEPIAVMRRNKLPDGGYVPETDEPPLPNLSLP